MKYLSLFTGIGGFELGIGDKVECIGFSEIDKYAIQTYQSHFPTHKNYGDITKINEKELPEFDLIVGGFPCQSFSIAGKRRGFEDTRGTLFFDIARIIKAKQPRLLLLENVKGLLSHDKGDTFRTIIATLDELGYDLQWQVLNSKNFGVPQNRERVFIVGHLRGTPRPEVFPFTESNRRYNEPQTEAQGKGERIRGNVASTLAARDYKGGGNLIQLNNPIHSNDRVYDPEGLSPTLNTMQVGSRQPFVALTETRTEEAKKIRSENLKKGKDWSPRRGKELTPRKDDQANTLTGGQTKEHLISDGIKIRRLTPTECERLQGFPDNWTAGVSDTQRYKQCGNAVTVNVIKAIVEKLLPTQPQDK